MLPGSRSRIAHIRKDSHTCTICRIHFITKSSSCSRRFGIACFLSPLCTCVPIRNLKGGGVALPRGPSIIATHCRSTLVRDLCTIIVMGQNCRHSSLHQMCLFANLSFSKSCSPTRAGSTFSIFSTFHVAASDLNSCFEPNIDLSVRVLIDTWAFQNSHSRS